MSKNIMMCHRFVLLYYDLITFTLFDPFFLLFFLFYQFFFYQILIGIFVSSLEQNLRQKIVDQFTKLSKIGFSRESLKFIFSNFLAQLSKFAFWLAGWCTDHQFQGFQGFS